ncbi:MAG TPA: hypothetical protein PLN99_04320, partial [Daejeonella sp.]|nr:hypothetical protein [Daejeonella sp.]
IVLVSLVPCADGATNSQSSVKTIISETSASKNHNELSRDACSPFCVCACCNTPTFTRKISLSKFIPSLINMKFPNNTPGKATSTSISVWQPPRLG